MKWNMKWKLGLFGLIAFLGYVEAGTISNTLYRLLIMLLQYSESFRSLRYHTWQ